MPSTLRRISVRTLAAATATFAAAALLAAPAHARPTRSGPLVRPMVGTHATSSNWSGYAITQGHPFSSVTASWVQPAGHCTSRNTYASFWIGIDGDGSNSVEQTGSEVDCRNGRPVYYAWYEMYPQFPVNYSNPVSPGDHFSAKVTGNAQGVFVLTIKDVTKGWSHTVRKTYLPAQRFSAEVIAEAPSSASGVLPLTNFGTMTFSASTANGRSLGQQRAVAITMSSGGHVKAKPGPINNAGGFSVTWHHV